jgi:molecular chaperone Hsp33
MPTSFECNCGHEKFLNAIKGLGQAEIESMINEDHGAEQNVTFAETNINIQESELQELLEKMQ